MLTWPPDYYADAHEIAARLAESNQREWSDRIERAIEEGYTATEILMGLRFQLAQLVLSDASLSDDTRALIEDPRQSIEEAIR
jgi:hypothetical protein